MTALDRVFELAARVGELMTIALTERGLTTARAEVLHVLHRRAEETAGQGMVQRELSQALRCSPRHVTALVDALEAGGWVARRRHPTDRRATLVTLTDHGVIEAARMDRERRDAARALFGDLPETDLASFVAVADHVLAQLTPPCGPDTGPAEPLFS